MSHRAIDVAILLVSIALTAMSIAGTVWMKNNTTDYRAEMTEDCSYGRHICKRTETNPYTVVEEHYICKHHVADNIAKGQVIKDKGTKFGDAKKVNENLYEHVKFYTWLENGLITVPILQTITLAIFIVLLIISWIKGSDLTNGGNIWFSTYVCFQNSAGVALSASVFGLAVMEVHFGERCISSDIPEWMLTSITLAKFMYWGWVAGLILMLFGLLFYFASFTLHEEGENENAQALACWATGGCALIIAVFWISVLAIMGAIFYLWLWIAAKGR